MGSPTMRRRRLAAELRRLRKQAELPLEEAARQLEWQASKLSRIENRKNGISTTHLRRLLDLYGVTDEAQRETLLDMARRAKERGWWQAYGDVIPSEYGTLIGLESEAATLRTYQPELVHGLLQTPDYARAVIRTAHPTDTIEQLDRRVEVRLARQQMLTQDDPPQFRVVLGEGAVRRQVGGHEVMRKQLHHLVADRDRGNVVVQVLPFSAGEHPAMLGPFEISDFSDPEDLGMVYVENLAGAMLLEEPEQLRQYGAAFDAVTAAALSPADSRTMLKKLAEE